MIKQIVCNFVPSADPLTPRTPVRLLTLSGPASAKVTSRKEVLRKTRIAIATMVLTLGAVGLCSAQQPQEGRTCIERIRDIDLTEAQEATIAGIQDEYAPKVEEAVTALKSVIDEELDKLRAVLTPEQLVKTENMKEERKTRRLEGLTARIAHLRDLDLTEDEMDKIDEIRNEYCPKIVQALKGLKGTLTPEQAKVREDALKAGKSRREVMASLQLTDDQKAKVESVGKEVRTLVQEELAKMRDVLTPEQQEKLESTKEDRREHVRDRLASRIANLKELDLTDQQVSQIKAIRAEYRPKVQEAGNSLRAVVREEIAAIVAVLKA